MLTINDIYGHGYGEAQIERLCSLGFKIRDQVSRFAGSQLLRFIDFSKRPSLEFIEVENESEYFDFLPKGMVSYCPGIGLLIPQSSSKDISDFQRTFQVWGCNSRHANYDGSDEPDKPGSNNLNFDVPVVKDTFVYLTKLDDPKPVRKVVSDHPNTAKQVIGLIFDLDKEKLVKLANLTGVEIVGGGMDLDGVQIWSSNALVGKIGIPKKRFPLAAIVVKAESIDFFREKEEAKIFEYWSKPTAYIQTTELSWDLIVTT